MRLNYEFFGRKRSKILFFIIFILTIFVFLFDNAQLLNVGVNENIVTFYLARSNSYASNWTYKMSNNTVLEEEEAGILDYIKVDYDYWKFRPIEKGEVTIYFTAHYELAVVEEDCFSITYYVDESGTVTEISSDNKPEKINFDDNIVGLVWLKTVDFLINYIDRKISFIVDGEFMRLFR